MARYRGPVGKISRRLGIGITEKGQRILSKRAYPPGQHGPAARRRQVSDYGLQLQEKQKARYMYGVLERRLDNVVYRMGFATTRSQARQIVNHGHITVNGRKTNIPSYTVRVGEKIAIRPESRRRAYFKNLTDSGELNRRNVPDWLRLNAADLAGEIVSLPRREDAEQGINEQLIVEYYSRRKP